MVIMFTISCMYMLTYVPLPFLQNIQRILELHLGHCPTVSIHQITTFIDVSCCFVPNLGVFILYVWYTQRVYDVLFVVTSVNFTGFITARLETVD